MAVEDLWRRKDGSPTARDGRGKRWRVQTSSGSRAFRTKAEAEAWWLEQLRAPSGPRVSAVTVGELVDRWLATKADKSAATRRAAELAASRVRERWGSVGADQVRSSELRAWLAGLQVGASYRRQVHQCVAGALQLAVGDGLLSRSPMDGVKPPVVPSRDPRFMSVSELRELAEAAGAWRPMVLLMGTTGIRIGEACGLDVGDVVPSRGRLRVRPEVSKSPRGRDVPVPPSVLRLLDLAHSGPLFRSPAGRRVDADNWRARVFAPAAASVGREGMNPHELRHTAASLAIAAGADVLAVQRMLGHRSAAVTLGVYGHLWDEGLDRISARMDAELALPDHYQGS